MRSLLGTNTPSTVTWEPTYISPAAGNSLGNAGEVFLKLDPAQIPALVFDRTRSGGLVAPNIRITGLSRAFGPVDADTTNGVQPDGSLLNGKFAPQIFADTVKILGGLALQDLLASQNADYLSAFVPSLQHLFNPDGSTTTRYYWAVDGIGLFKGGDIFAPKDGAHLELNVTLVRPAAPGAEPQVDVSGSLSNVSITLSAQGESLVRLDIETLAFSANSGSKPDFSVLVTDFVFLGKLSLLNQLALFLPKDGFKDPPYMTVDGRGATVGYSLGLPSLGIGMFTLQNISLTASFFLPFTDEESNLHLAFCERHQPFLLTVMGLGGGGFVGLDIGIGGMRLMEASLEFGASVAINLGVASGSAAITGGVYLQLAGGGVTFAAFFRAAGELSVLGLISVSVEFYMGLEYANKDAGGGYSSLKGVATLKVEIEILFFSTSVDITMERTFAGSDPTFAQVMDQDNWSDYCAAFA